jgi:hypothetical protein
MKTPLLRFLPTLLILISLVACAPAGGPRETADATQKSPNREVASDQASTASNVAQRTSNRALAKQPSIEFTVTKDGDSKRVHWYSKKMAGDNVQICFENAGVEPVLCVDVKPGKSSGELYATSSMPIEECTAVFRPRK